MKANRQHLAQAHALKSRPAALVVVMVSLIVAGLLATACIPLAPLPAGADEVSSAPQQPAIPVILRPAPPPPGHFYPGGVFVSLEEAQARLPFPLLVPTVLPAGVELVSVELNGSVDPFMVALHYSNGIIIEQEKVSGPWDVRKIAAQFPDTMRITDVHGIAAMGQDPGVSRDNVTGAEIPYPGAISWYTSDVGFTVYGDLPMEELRRIAESLVPYEP